VVSIKKLVTTAALVAGTSVAGIAPAMATTSAPTTTSAPAKVATSQYHKRCHDWGYHDYYRHRHHYHQRYCKRYDNYNY
jgi:hypothetical protein